MRSVTAGSTAPAPSEDTNTDMQDDEIAQLFEDIGLDIEDFRSLGF